MVVCPPARVLVSIIDRYGLEHWMKGIYEQKSDGLEDSQVLDVVEDMIHLLIVLICDRISLAANEDVHVQAMRRDITHVLCFKPLSFSDISAKLPDKFQEQEECQEILDEMTTFKPPEGLSDVGTFELKSQYLEHVDPYISHYNKNQREESENLYKNWMAQRTGKSPSDVVFEAKLRPIEVGLFQDLAGFTRTGIFAQIIYYALLYPLNAERLTPTVPSTRVEAFLQVVLHLVLIAIAEDKTDEEEMSEESLDSFVYIALTKTARSNFLDKAPSSRTIAAVLEMLSRKDEYKACHAKINLVLIRMKQKRPVNFETAFIRLGVPVDRISTASPANNNAIEERERKKRAAMERQAKVMAQFQQQQKNFMDNQGDIDWGEDIDSGEEVDAGIEHENPKTYWQYPSGTCILCQEDTKDGGLYGTFALMMESNILRQTDFSDPDFVREVAHSPANLDVSAEELRPAGVSGENRAKVHKVTGSGVEMVTERQYIGKGFPKGHSRPGTISVGCGHIMHYKCFEVYYEASQRRHQHQIARHHPENLSLNEFVCPLCKALGNAFLPIVWSPKEERTFHNYVPGDSFDQWISTMVGANASTRPRIDVKQAGDRSIHAVEVFMQHNKEVLNAPLVAKMPELLLEAWSPVTVVAPAMPFAAPPDLRIPGAPLVQGIWGNEEAGPSSSGQPAPTPVSPMSELARIYRRLRETMRKNKLPTKHDDDPALILSPGNDLFASDTLAESLGYSISAVEIQQRGIASPQDKTFLDTLPQQALTHLRILADSAASYVSVGGIKQAGDNRVTREFCKDYERLFQQLFLRSPYGPDEERELHELGLIGDTLLGKDIFVFLTECSLCLAPVDNVDIMHIVRLCYLAELVKVVIKLDRNKGNSDYLKWISFEQQHESDDLNDFARFCRNVRMSDTKDGNLYKDGVGSTALEQSCFTSLESCRKVVKKYALAFLRKVAILLSVRYGITFSHHVSSKPSADELDRLTDALKLPNFDEMCRIATYPYGTSYSQLSWLVDGWIGHANMGPAQTPATVISLSHPVIFELIGLPKNYDTLMEEVMKRRCPTTGKDVSDPALCLFCGEIFCGQAICCLKPAEPSDGLNRTIHIGGAQQHMKQ
jgi:E3 ubiquitin-protein ligase UBR1